MDHLRVPWIVSRVADSDPGVLVGSGFEIRLASDLVFKKWSDPDPVCKIWSDTDPVLKFGRIWTRA